MQIINFFSKNIEELLNASKNTTKLKKCQTTKITISLHCLPNMLLLLFFWIGVNYNCRIELE